MKTRLTALVATFILMTTATAKGQTADEVRNGSAKVIVSETEFFGELYLQVEVAPSYDVADGVMGVTLISQRQLSECTYRNAGPIFEGDPTNTLLSGDIDCFGGARFPLDRLETVEADMWGDMFSPGTPLECRADAKATDPACSTCGSAG